jgi:thiamine biosynthesis protein ThiS
MMKIKINGQWREVEASTIQALLEELGLSRRLLVIEHNLEIIEPQAYEQTVLAEGDQIEIVHFVGGG